MFDFFFLRRYSSEERMLYILYYYLPFSLYNIWCISLCKNNYITEPFKRCIMSVILPFHAVPGVLKARILKWFAVPFSSGWHSVRPLHNDPSVLGGPTGMAHSFIELDKTVVHGIRLASFLWLWFLCVCPLMPSHNACHLTWVSLTLEVRYLLTAAAAKRSRCSLPWTRGISSPPPLLTLNVE